MKKFRILLLTFASLLFSISCDDFIDLEPTDFLSEDLALETPQDFEQAIIGCYSGLIGGGYYGGNFVATMDWVTDDFRRSSENLGQGVQMHSFIYDSGTGEPGALWAAAYNIINRANIILGKVDAVVTDPAQLNSIKGQALFIRALCHFDLVRTFADNFNATPDASHLGVPLMIESKIDEPARNTVAEVYTQIVSDLTESSNLLDNTASKTKITKLAAQALLARVHLYRYDYSAAEAAATVVIDDASVSLATGTVYQNMWTSAEDLGEVIFKLDFQVGNATLGGNYWGENNDIVFFNPTQDLIDLYNQTDDIRFPVFLGVRQPADPDNLFTKYRGAPLNSPLTTLPAVPGLADFKLLRESEMYLIRAEARFELNNQAGALADLNTLRAARINNFTAGTETDDDLDDAIQLERRKELVGEVHRWFDLKRRNQSIVRGDDCSATQCELEDGNFRFVFPIPQAEVFANRNIVQNDGYN
ncbi:MAG: RagB/SusD family nutrient uptake outer membrane protein [Cytophagales bacterium]|jgi:hypothetical protein|nr:RagB/SusD family nutrient uptake outer membrane protein [Cytophagales bacterium]